MTLNIEELQTEISEGIDAIDAAKAEEAELIVDYDGGDAGAKPKGKGGVPDDPAIKDEAALGDAAGEAEGSKPAKDDPVVDDGPAEGEGDAEGDRPAGEVPKEAAPTLSDHAVEQAIIAGIPISEVRSFPNDAALLRVADIVQKANAGAVEPGEKVDDDPLSGIPDLDPEEFQPKVIEMFDALKGVIKNQQEKIESIHEQQSVADAAVMKQQSDEVEVWFDREVAELGEDFAESLGEGGYRGLAKGSPQEAKREAIAQHLELLFAGYAQRGKTPPPRSEIFRSAARSVLHDEFREIGSKKVASKLAKRSTQHTQRASGSRATSHLSPEAEAAEAVDKKFPPKR